MKNDEYKELADMIDECIKKGSSHINVSVGKESKVQNRASGSCEGGACSAPTLHKGIDD